MICSLNYFILDFYGNFEINSEMQNKNRTFLFIFQIDMEGDVVLTIPRVTFLFLCVCLDWLTLRDFRKFFPAKMAASSLAAVNFKASSLLLHCGVNSKWLMMIKQKMKVEWHYLKIYLKPWQVSICSNISVSNTWRIQNGGLLYGQVFLLWNQKGKIPMCSKTRIWISKQGRQSKYTNYTWTWNLITLYHTCFIPVVMFSFVYRYYSHIKKRMYTCN